MATKLAQSLLEREPELAALQAAVERVREGNGGLLVIEGSAGIGKTRLLTQARVAADGAGLRLLSARGGELEQEFAFGLVRQLFEPLLATSPPAERADLLAGAAALSAPLFSDADPGAAAGGEVSFAMLHGLYWLAANIAFSAPAVLLVDDAHWGDAPSLRWLIYLARRLEGVPLLLVVATRPPEQSQHDALLTELLTDAAAVVLKPGLLTRDSVTILAREAFASEPEQDFCAACHSATGGNPLYLEALLVSLVTEGIAPVAKESARALEAGPEAVTRVVSLRLTRLAPEAGALARALAVLGTGADLRLGTLLARLDDSVAAEAAGALVRSDLLRAESALEFAHPVVRAAVYETIGPVDRADAHRRAAALLADAGSEPEQAAAHLLLVPGTGDWFATSVLRRAAQRAFARGASGEAAVYLRRALAEPPPDEERAELLAELGEVEVAVDVLAAVDHLREAVGLIEDPARHAEVGLMYGRVLTWTGFDNAGASEVLRVAIERAAPDQADLREQATADLISATWMAGESWPIARRMLGELQEGELAGGLGSDMLRAVLAHYELRRGLDRERGSALAKEALASGRLSQLSSHALYFALDALRATGEFDAALAAYESALASARQRGDLLNVGGLLAFRGWLLIDKGDLRSAEQDIREGLEFSLQHAAPGQAIYPASFLCDLLLEQGAPDEAARALAEVELPDEIPEQFPFAAFLEVRGKLGLAQREPERALADFEALRRITERLEIANPAEWPWRSRAAMALHALGRDDEARRLAREELEHARRWGLDRALGLALRTLGLVEEGEEGERRLREAVDVLAPSPARLEYAKALIDLGAAMRRRKERVAARALLRQGVDVAHKCAAFALAERGNEELATTGARPRKLLLTGLDSLTASERRVAQLAAEDLSNKEIAQTLFVTVKTIEVHLSNVYRKLDISSRRQLPEALGGTAPVAVA